MSIQDELNQIKSAVYGSDVRGAIHDSIKKTYDDASANGNANMEVELARGTEPTLNDRLGKMDDKDQEVTAQLAHKVTKFEDNSISTNMLTQEVKNQMTGGSVAVVGTSSVNVETLTPDVADYLYTKGEVNIFNKKTATQGYMDSLGVVSPAETLMYSEPIPVAGNGAYFFYEQLNPVALAVRRLTEFDENMNALGTSANQHEYRQNIRVSPETRYMVITFATTQRETVQVIRGENPPSVYTPYYTKKKSVQDLENNVNDLMANVNTSYNDKVILTYGDSQTGQNKWQPLIEERLNTLTINDGHGGYPIAQVDDSQVGFSLASDYMLGQLSQKITENNVDIVTVMGFTNDINYDGRNPDYNAITLGDFSLPYNVKTAKGALSKIVAYISSNHPTVRVVVLSPVGGLTKETGVNLTEPFKNELGYRLGDFAKVCEEVAHYFSVHFIDVFQKSGINFLNSSTFIEDGTHLKADTGGKRVAEVIVGGLKEIEPIS